MKYLLLAAVSALLCFACNKESVELTGQQTDIEKYELSLHRLASKTHNETSAISKNYTLKGEANHRPNGKPMWDLIQQLNAAKNQIPLAELQDAVDRIIEAYDIDVLQYDRDFRPAIQLFAYEVGHRAALREPHSLERNKVIIKSLDILVIQQADDTDAFAEMLREVKSDLSRIEFKRYYDYIRKVAEDKIVEFEANFEQYKSDFPSDNGSELDKRRWLADNRGTAQRYEQAFIAIALLDGMAAEQH